MQLLTFRLLCVVGRFKGLKIDCATLQMKKGPTRGPIG